MKYRKLTNDGDYSFGGNSSDYVQGADAIGYAVRTKLLLFYQEWWEDLGQGIPMFQSILGQVNPELIRNSLTKLVEERILEVEGTNSVQNLEINIDKTKRTISMSCTVETESEETVEVEVMF